MRKRPLWLLIPIAVLGALGVAVVVGPMCSAWFPPVLTGATRNQRIDSRIVERKVRIGMTTAQVESVLHLRGGTARIWSRPRGRGTETEIAGSWPPWQAQRPGRHTIVLRFDNRGRVLGGYSIWWDADCSDSEPLQLQ